MNLKTAQIAQFSTNFKERNIYSIINSLIENNPDVEILNLNCVWLNKYRDKFNSTINENPTIVSKKYNTFTKLNISTLTTNKIENILNTKILKLWIVLNILSNLKL